MHLSSRKLLFNHIPKTGGVTLRIILNRVYGIDKVFLISSTNIGESLSMFGNLTDKDRDLFDVVAGHGAELFAPMLKDPFRITILREPLALFVSQYHYLRTRTDSGFYDAVRPLQNLEEYIDFAVKNGQDNLLTRYLSDSLKFLANTDEVIPDMRKSGDDLLVQAIHNLQGYDAVIDLDDFDAGVFALAHKLGWKKIPVYRKANTNKNNPGVETLDPELRKQLQELLKYDLALYSMFKEMQKAEENKINRKSIRFRLFLLRQKGIAALSKMTGRE